MPYNNVKKELHHHNCSSQTSGEKFRGQEKVQGGNVCECVCVVALVLNHSQVI